MVDDPTPSRTRRLVAAVALALVAGLVAGLVALGGANPAAAAEPAPPVPAPAPPPGGAPLLRAEVDAWLDGLVPAGLEQAGIPGAAVAVVRDGRVLTARGYGFADTGTDGRPARPVDPDATLFRFGSVSKVLTATAVMQLVEQGRLDLDADVRDRLGFPLPLRFDAPVTLRHLLTHTAGFEERVRGLIAPDDGAEDLHATLAVDPPRQVFPPGTTPAYSNYGYGLAGHVVERVTGVPFAEHLRRAVLAPAGMTSSTFEQPLAPALRERLARGAATDDAPAEPFETVRPAPAGSLTASATDMARFAAALLAPSSPLLAPATREAMFRPGLGDAELGALAAGPRMALGLFDEGRNGRRILGHGGDTGFFHSHLQLYPDERTAVVVTTNGTGRAGDESLALRDAVTRGFADRWFPGPGPVAASSPTAAQHAPRMAGSYENARAPFSTFLSTMNLLAPTTVIARPDGTLLVVPGPLAPRPAVYHEIRPWVWQEVGGQRLLTARLDGDRVQALGVEGAFTLLPAPPWRAAAVVLPVLALAAGVLLVAVLVGPLALLRRGRRASRGGLDAVAVTSTRVGAACALVALGGWGAVVVAVSGLAAVPTPLLWVLVGLQVLAGLAIVPAVTAVVTGLRHRVGALRTAGRLLCVPALVAVTVVAWQFGLLGPDLSY